MLETLVVYLSVLLMMSFCASQGYLSSKDKINYWGKYTFASILIFTFVFGSRYNVGRDYLNYYDLFQYAHTGWGSDTVEEGFYAIVKFLNAYTNVVVYFSIFAFIQIFSLYYATRNKVYIVRYIPLVLMSGYFLQWMNIMRQAAVACFLLFLINYLNRKDFYKYIFVILVCSYFLHQSALILLLLLPIAFLDKIPFIPRWIQMICLLMSIIFNVLLSFYSLINFFVYYAIIFNYDVSVLGVEAYSDEYNYGPTSLMKILIFFIVLLYSNDARKFYNDRYCDIVFVLFFFGICFILLFQGNHILKRPFEYFANMELIVVPYVLNYLHRFRYNGINGLVYSILLFSYFALFFIMIYKSIGPNSFSAFTFIGENVKL